LELDRQIGDLDESVQQFCAIGETPLDVCSSRRAAEELLQTLAAQCRHHSELLSELLHCHHGLFLHVEAVTRRVDGLFSSLPFRLARKCKWVLGVCR
jgi:hypothetical protein